MRLHPLLLAGMVLLGGCGTFRGIPSHGGGKRFDEEQRIVASAIRQSLAEMDLQELRGKRVRVVLESIAHEGSGNVNWPGLTNVGVTGSIASNENNYVLFSPDRVSVSDTQSTGVSGSTNYRANPEYYSSYSGTGQDLAYLHAVLEMKARHEGLLLDGEPQAALFVLVDVLGTNRSRRSYMFKGTDNYHASCEITYYAQDLASGELIFRERQTGAMSAYEEEHTWLSPWIAVGYTTVPVCPIVPLLDEGDRPVLSMDEPAPTSQPAPASQEPMPRLLGDNAPAAEPADSSPEAPAPLIESVAGLAPAEPSAEPAAQADESSAPTPVDESPAPALAQSAPAGEVPASQSQPATQPAGPSGE